jgi:hypothetical protein
MPYIKQQDRDKFLIEYPNESTVDAIEFIGELCNNPGDLNYVITSILQTYIKTKGENYQHYNDCLGALEGAKMELYRRKCAPYEDKKIAENGDVNI